MTIGIEVLIDFAFKKVFGSTGNEIVLIGLLNALLRLRSPIAKVQILNPYNDKDFEDDKLSILDLRAEDEHGRIFTIEVQLSARPGLIQRVVFYGCEVYAGQLMEGQDYSELKPVYTICLYRGVLWPQDVTYQHRFQLADVETGRILEETVAIHLVELFKYNLQEAELATATTSDRWLYWLLHSHEYTSEELLKLFPELAIQQATRSLNDINLITKDKQMYDLRKKAEIDYHWGLTAAKKEGIEIGEARGEARGIVKALQEILGICLYSDEELHKKSLEELATIVTDLRSRTLNRPISGDTTTPT